MGTPAHYGENDPVQTRAIQDYERGFVVLKVKNSWKVVRSEMIAVKLDFSDYSGNCPDLTGFDFDESYFVFAYNKDFKVTMECPDSARITKGYEYPKIKWRD